MGRRRRCAVLGGAPATFVFGSPVWTTPEFHANPRPGWKRRSAPGAWRPLEPTRVGRFSLPILEAAGIGQVSGRSGAAAMAAVLKAVREAGGAADLRGDVAAGLEAG